MRCVVIDLDRSDCVKYAKLQADDGSTFWISKLALDRESKDPEPGLQTVIDLGFGQEGT